MAFVAGCDRPTLKPLPADGVILAFGDSLTYGVGAKRGAGYPEVLQELSQLTVINAGISGETTTQGVIRFQSVLEKHNPDLVILLEGGNDILRNHAAAEIKQNLDKMIQTAGQFGAQVILIGVPEKKLFSDSAYWYEELADQYQLVFDGEKLSELLRSPQMKSGPIHLNEAGYRQFAEHLYQLLSQHGAF